MTAVASDTIAALRCTLGRLRIDPQRLADGGLYTITLTLDAAPKSFPADLPPPFFVWARPDRRHWRLGLGIAWSAEARGRERLQQLQAAFATVTRSWHHDAPAGAALPGVFCAFAFDDETSMSGPWAGMPANLLAVPEVLLERKDGRCTLSLSCNAAALTGPPDGIEAQIEAQIELWLNHAAHLLNVPPSPDAPGPDRLDRAHGEVTIDDWQRLVEDARRQIAAGHLAKVVLARQVSITANRPFRYAAILDRLAQAYPNCLLLGVALGERTLVAATPERLVALQEGIAHCDALGGTGRRGADPADDQRRAERLLHDAKTRHEHALVVEHVARALREMATEVATPETPSVMSLGGLHHLWSQVVARCRPDVSLLALASGLHPTPAVAGMPTVAAKAWLARQEPLDRGWYTGGIGWLETNGDGEMAVLLRCALLSGRQASLYAGAGIVDASDPAEEFEETELKLGAIIGALVESGPISADRTMRTESAL